MALVAPTPTTMAAAADRLAIRLALPRCGRLGLIGN
jgi:hypothetical protein